MGQRRNHSESNDLPNDGQRFAGSGVRLVFIAVTGDAPAFATDVITLVETTPATRFCPTGQPERRAALFEIGYKPAAVAIKQGSGPSVPFVRSNTCRLCRNHPFYQGVERPVQLIQVRIGRIDLQTDPNVTTRLVDEFLQGVEMLIISLEGRQFDQGFGDESAAKDNCGNRIDESFRDPDRSAE
jgi:hypothetical protein